MANTVRLESQIWSVMESLSRAAVDEICKLVEAECVEMRLEIRRGQSQIESLKTEIRGLKEELGHDSASTVSQADLHSEDGRDEEQEQEQGPGKLHQGPVCSAEKDTMLDISGVRSNAEENHRTYSSPLSSGSDHNQSGMILIHEQDVQCRKSHILNASQENKDVGETGFVPKVECESYPVSTEKGFSDIYQSDQKLHTDPTDHFIGGDMNQFGTSEDFQLESHPSVTSHNQMFVDTVPYKSDTRFCALPKPWKSEEKLGEVEFKSEQEELPLSQSVTMDTSAPLPSLPPMNLESTDTGTDFPLELHQRLPAPHFEPQVLRLDTADPRTRRTRAQKNWDRVPNQTHKLKSASLSVMLTKVKILPRADNKCKSFSCSVCLKNFLSATDLNRHLRIHTGEKPYSCSLCGKRFSLKGNLITHERVHSGIRPFVCQFCGRGFTQRTNRDVHQRIHTGEKPYSCSLCGKCFTHRGSFINHQRAHNGT